MVKCSSHPVPTLLKSTQRNPLKTNQSRKIQQKRLVPRRYKRNKTSLIKQRMEEFLHGWKSLDLTMVSCLSGRVRCSFGRRGRSLTRRFGIVSGGRSGLSPARRLRGVPATAFTAGGVSLTHAVLHGGIHPEVLQTLEPA